MARKKDVVKKIDIKTKASGAPLPLIQEDQPVPPAFYLIPAPDTLVLIGQAIQRSTQSPLVQVAIGWQEAPNIAPDYYNVEYDESSSFTNVQRRRANTTSATVDSLKANGVTYYFRVQAVLGGIYSDFSDVLSVVTMSDNTPPPDVTGASAAYQNSDLVITYTIPVSEIIKDVEIKIYNAAHTILYATLYPTTNRLVWTAEQNSYATGGTPLKSVSVDIHTRSWTNFLSVTGVNVTATAPLPSTPTGYASNWISDTGIASGDFITSWLGAANANDYELTIDGTVFYTKDLKFIYSYEQNVNAHKPTLPSGDPSFIWLLKARDKLGQVSTPVNVTVTNAAPPSGVMALSVVSGFSTLGVTVSLLGNTIVQDFDHYEWAVSSGSTVLQTFNSPDSSVIFQLNAAGTYTPSVRMVDKFNQKSAILSGAPQVLDTLTIGELRTETTYTDSFNTNFTGSAATVFKDGTLYTGSLGNAIRYATTSGTWNWVKASRPLSDRYKTITFAAAWSTISRIYYEFNDGTTSTYYAAPVTVSSVGDRVLTSYATQALARTNAIPLTPIGNTTTSWRYDTPSIQEARSITLWFNTDGSNFDLYEYYPRRLVQSDDMEAESIRSINIAALGINADRIFATSLSAFTASMGSLHIDSLLDIASTGIIFQGTGSGTLAQNAATPTSFAVTGLKIYNSSGVGRLATYNAGVEQVALDTDGKFKAGAGQVLLDASGVTLLGRSVAEYTGTTTAPNVVQWKIGTEVIGSIEAYYDTGSTAILSIGANSASYLGKVSIYAKTRAGMYIGTGSVNQISVDDTNTATIKATNVVFSNATNVAARAVGGLFYPGNQTSYYLRDAAVTPYFATGIMTNDNMIVGGNIYWGTGGAYLSAYINQALLTTSNVIHNAITTAQLIVSNTASPRLTVNTTSGVNNRAEIYFSKNNASGWLVGTDLAGSNANDFFFYDVANSQARVQIGAAGNVGIQQKLYIGALGVTPTALIQLASDSALKPSTATWQITSTKQAKDNIKTRKSALSRIKQLRLTEFDFNGKYNTINGHKGVGFIAEEARSVYPNAVEELEYTNADGTTERYLALNPHEIFMDYAAAIQELEAKVAMLEAKGK